MRRWRDVLTAAAVNPRLPAAARTRLGAVCVRHELVPDNEIERALFFVLTGQHERYEALDPDGTLLAGGYRGAPEATRKALRDTMLGLGAVDLVRVVAERPDHPLTGTEADYLATQLARAGEWDRLWRLVPTFPLASAVRAAPLFGHWRPPDDAGRALLRRLATTDPAALGAAADAAVNRFPVTHPSRYSFAPDGSELAVGNAKGTVVLDSRTGRRLAEYPAHTPLALGDGAIVHTGSGKDNWSVVRCTPDRPYEVLVPDKPGAGIGGTPDGFVVSFDRNLWFGAATGSWTRQESVDESARYALAAADPVSGRLVLRASKWRDLVLYDADLTVLARFTHNNSLDGLFCGPDRLLLAGTGHTTLESWQRDGTTFVRTATVGLDDNLLPPAPLPARDLVVIRREGRLAWLDAATLTEVDRPSGFPAIDAWHMAFSRDGTLAAVARFGEANRLRNTVEVYDLGLCQLTPLLDTSFARMVPSDLAAVEALAGRELTPPVAAAVDLLRAGLAHRFGTDIALGAGGDRAGADDIALGGDR